MQKKVAQSVIVSFNSPLKEFYLIATEDSLLACSHQSNKKKQDFFHQRIQREFTLEVVSLEESYPLIQRTEALLQRYATEVTQENFTAIKKLPYLLLGTDFERDVWKIVAEIPFGNSLSYGEIAERMGNKKGARGVGRSVGMNPLSLIIPCHRVLGKTGAITGYAGGLEKKRYLLNQESIPFVEPQAKSRV